MLIVTHAPPQFNASRATRATWAGLAVRSEQLHNDERVLRDVLGHDAAIVVVDSDEPPVASVRRLVRSGASAILVVADAYRADCLKPLLQVACSLASFRRIVLLHESQADIASWFQGTAILLLRDDAVVRASIRAIVAHDQLQTLTRVRPVEPPPLGTALHPGSASDSFSNTSPFRTAEPDVSGRRATKSPPG